METINTKQGELDTFIAEGYKTALSEERRRYCFLVDRQCAVAKNSSAYHGKVRDGANPCDGLLKSANKLSNAMQRPFGRILAVAMAIPRAHSCHVQLFAALCLLQLPKQKSSFLSLVLYTEKELFFSNILKRASGSYYICFIFVCV